MARDVVVKPNYIVLTRRLNVVVQYKVKSIDSTLTGTHRGSYDVRSLSKYQSK
jgi:hypothetical protein